MDIKYLISTVNSIPDGIGLNRHGMFNNVNTFMLVSYTPVSCSVVWLTLVLKHDKGHFVTNALAKKQNHRVCVTF